MINMVIKVVLLMALVDRVDLKVLVALVTYLANFLAVDHVKVVKAMMVHNVVKT
jgi:hypothetical protein